MWRIKTEFLAPGVLGAVALDDTVRMTFLQVISLSKQIRVRFKNTSENRPEALRSQV